MKGGAVATTTTTKVQEVARVEERSKEEVTEVEKVAEEGAEDGTDLFPASAYKPLKEEGEGVELSFEGQVGPCTSPCTSPCISSCITCTLSFYSTCTSTPAVCSTLPPRASS